MKVMKYEGYNDVKGASKSVIYGKWTGMIKRCYSPLELEKMPCYKDCTVCDEWLYFSNFKTWMEQQDWEGKHLDKDLLVEGNKVYSPDNCVFIDPDLNVFMTLRGQKRGNYPLGVNFKKANKKLVAQITLNGEKTYLGLFKDPMLAHRAYQMAKRDQAIYLQSQQTCERTIKGLQRIIDKLQYHLDNNLETKDL